MSLAAAVATVVGHAVTMAVLRMLQSEEVAAAPAGPRISDAEEATSVVFRLFGIMLRSELCCTLADCGHRSCSYVREQAVSLEITEWTSTLEECLEAYTAPEKLDKSNKYKCEKCGAFNAPLHARRWAGNDCECELKMSVAAYPTRAGLPAGREVRARKQVTFELAPRLLVLSLKRFRMGFQGKINTSVCGCCATRQTVPESSPCSQH